MFLTIICILILLYSFAGLLYYIVDSFQRKEYWYTIGFGFYSMLILFLIGKAIKILITMI